MNFFTNMKVTGKLLLLLVVMLIGFAAVGVTYIVVLKAEATALTSTEQTTQFQAGIEEIKREVGDAVVRQRDFVISHRLEDLDRFENMISRVRGKLDELEAQAPSDQLKQLIRPVNDVLTRFHSSVYQLAEVQIATGLDQDSGLQGDMRSAVHDMESTLNKAVESSGGATSGKRSETSGLGSQFSMQKLLTSMLMMRRHEKNYLQHETQKDADRMAGEKENFLKLLEQPKLPDETKATLRELLTAYHASFLDLVEVTAKLQQERTGINTEFAAIAPVLKSVTEATDELAGANLAALEAKRNELSTLFITMLAVTAIVIAVLVYFLGRGITNPMQQLQATVQRVAQGDMNARARLGRRDEIGDLASAFDNLLDERIAQEAATERERATRLEEAEHENDALNTSVIDLLQAVAQLSQRDLTVRVPVADDVTGPVADALNLLTNETAQVLTEVTSISDAVASASRRVKSQSDSVVTLATQEREQVTQTSNELAEAAEAMSEIAALAQRCNTTAENAIQRTEAALETVTSTVSGINAARDTIRETEKRIKRLGERSQEISGVVNLINNIAERTHILALNASMHAASAGEAGRGFAVVADEVQRLAENARQATEQIAGLVGNIQTETMDTVTTMNTVITQVVDGSRLAEQAGDQMRETQQTTAELVESVRQIAEGSETQAKVSNELRNRAAQIVDSTLQTSQQLEEQSLQTNQLLDYSSQLVNAVGVFRLPGHRAGLEAGLESIGTSEAEIEDQEAFEVMIES